MKNLITKKNIERRFFLLSTLNCPNVDQRPASLWLLHGLQKCFGDLASPALQAVSSLWVVAPCATLPNMKTP